MIRVENICKRFSDESVLEDITLNIKEGECVVLEGVSGSGKSTLLSIIGAIMRPTSGLVEVDGLNVASVSDFHLSRYRTGILGFVTQDFNLFDALSVRENVVVPLLMLKLDKGEFEDRVDEAMKAAHIKHKSDHVASRLSGGEKQRCMIARALVNRPKILLFDEPTANLDKANSLKFAKLLKMLKDGGKTLLIATHDPLVSELDFVDRIINIDEGKIE